jgi:hypothetical protein
MKALTDYPTPRTNAQILTMECEDSCCDIYSKLNGAAFEGDVVPYDHARDLERKLAMCRDALESIRQVSADTPVLTYQRMEHLADVALDATK